MSFNQHPNPETMVEKNAVQVGPGDTLNFEEGSNIAHTISKNGHTITINTAATGSASGESNTSSNAGLSGVGLVMTKVGVDLPFKAIDAGSSKITVSNDAVNNTVDIDVAEGNITHQNLSGAGSNTHAQIDTHLADATVHRQINDAGSATTDLWSASKLTTELSGKAASSHSHTLSNISDAGSLAAKNTIATADIDADAVTYAKLQNVSATDRLLGRSTAGAGDVEEIVCTAAGRALLDDANATAQRSTLSAATTSQTFQMSYFVPTPADGDVTIGLSMAFAGTITKVTTKSASGTCTLTTKINGTALGGTANSVSSTEQAQSHGSANTFSVGDDLSATISSNASCADMAVTIEYTRTLS